MHNAVSQALGSKLYETDIKQSQFFQKCLFNFREILFEKEVKNETEDYADAPWCPTYEVEEIYKHQLTLKNKQEVRGIEFNLTRFVYIFQLYDYP